MPTTPLTIAVTGLNATDNPAPGVPVLRCLRRDTAGAAAHRLVGFSYDALDPGIYARDIADDVYMLPYPSSSPELFLERLRAIHEQLRLSVIVPTLDAELPAFIEIAPRLRELGIGLLLPTRDQYDARSKANLPSFARRIGLRTPQTLLVSSPKELRRMDQRLRYPFFVKGPYYGAKLVTCVEEALSAFHATVAEWGFPVIVQACVPGDDFEERNVVALGDGKGGMLGAVPMKKLAVTDKGKGWAGVTIRDPELIALTQRFVSASKWCGPCELELIRARDGAYYLIEINPRFPAWVFLAASAGINLPKLAVEMAAGGTPQAETEYTVGTMFVRISIDQIASVHDLEKLVIGGELHRG